MSEQEQYLTLDEIKREFGTDLAPTYIEKLIRVHKPLSRSRRVPGAGAGRPKLEYRADQVRALLDRERGKRTRLNMDEYSQKYGEICDVIERTYQGMPLEDDGLLHTSKEARAGANRVMQILGVELDPWK